MATLPLAPLFYSSSSTALASLPTGSWPPFPIRSRGGSLRLVGSQRELVAMASYTVKLLMPDGKEEIFDAPDDDYLLDTAEEKGVLLPASCRSGACSACCAKLVEGEVDQADGSFLSDDQIKDGYVLTCVAYPLTDVVLKTHLEGEVKS